MHTTVVGVLRGGASPEHEVSLKSGHAIMASLPPDQFTVRDLYIDKQGVWHERGLSTSPGNVLPKIDVAIICVHGELGELQKTLEQFGVPYTGADPFHTFAAAHKIMAKEKAKEAGLRTPRYLFAQDVSETPTIAREAVRLFSQPVVVKPVGSGSSVGVSLAGGYVQVHDAIDRLFDEGAKGVVVEERIRGIEATVGVVEGLRGQALYALPPVEIVPDGEFFSYDAKYSGKSEEIVPGRFSRQIADELMQAARTMHEALNQRHYSRSDFIVTKNGFYFLELNSAVDVGMTGESLMPKSLAAVGVKLPEFTTHLVELALRK